MLVGYFVVCQNHVWSLIIDTPIDIKKEHPYIKIIKVLQCERLELFLCDMKESSIISLGGKKKSISKYWW
jgi:hypothetical protein